MVIWAKYRYVRKMLGNSLCLSENATLAVGTWTGGDVAFHFGCVSLGSL